MLKHIGFLIKLFLNNKKILLFLHYITILRLYTKAGLFNLFFSGPCSLISNNSSLPSCINYNTEKHLSTVALSVETIV